MMQSVWAVVRDGRIELDEPLELPDGVRVLVTLLDDDRQFWSALSEKSLSAVWDNPEDDVYAGLLEG